MESPSWAPVKVSVIVPTWNGRKLLSLPLDSLRLQTFRDFEVIVVDDASGDDTLDFLRDNYPEVQVVALERNQGFPAAVNAGIRHGRGEVIALLNNDAAADERWLEVVVESLERHPEAGMLACRVQLYYHRDYLDSAGQYVVSSGAAGNRGSYQRDGADYAGEAWVLGPNGAAAIYRRAVFADIGLFDESYTAYHEDIDIALRAQFRGWKCLYQPAALCFHVGSATFAHLPVGASSHRPELSGGGAGQPAPPKPGGRVLFLSARNYPTILLRYLPLQLWLRDGWSILAYELNFILFAYRHGNLGAYGRGRLASLGRLAANCRRRAELWSQRRISVAEIESLFQRHGWREHWRKLRRKWI